MQRKKRLPVFAGGEGESEENYAAFLASLLEDQRRDHTIRRRSLGGGDHLAVIEEAVKRIRFDERRFQYRFRVRAVFLDSHLRNRNAGRDQRCDELIQAHAIVAVWQHPCFEGFLLRHFEGHENEKPASVSDAMKRLLAVWPQYEKRMTSHQLRTKLGIDGVRRARLVEPQLDAFLNAIGFT